MRTAKQRHHRLEARRARRRHRGRGRGKALKLAHNIVGAENTAAMIKSVADAMKPRLKREAKDRLLRRDARELAGRLAEQSPLTERVLRPRRHGGEPNRRRWVSEEALAAERQLGHEV